MRTGSAPAYISEALQHAGKTTQGKKRSSFRAQMCKKHLGGVRAFSAILAHKKGAREDSSR
jgi:hypothetical protein